MPADPSNYLGFLENFPQQCREALTLPKGMAVSGKVDRIVVCGVGGSAIGGDLLKAYMGRSKMPVCVCRSYELPKFVDEKTLVFCISYSGDTEETLSCFRQALEKKANVWTISSNGELAAASSRNIKVPSGLPPRAALGYLFFPMLGLLYNSSLAEVANTDLNEMLSVLKDTEAYKKEGNDLSKKFEGKIPIFYSSIEMGPTAYRWKTQINENAKQAAFFHAFPEMSHNEIVGYKSMSRSLYQPVLLRDKQDNERIKKRMDIFKELVSSRVNVEEVHSKGNGLLARMFSLIYLGDFASYYLAIRNRVDPMPVEIIDELKRRMAE